MAKYTFKKLTDCDKDWNLFMRLEKIAAKSSPYYLAFSNLEELKKFTADSIEYVMQDGGGKPIGYVGYKIIEEGKIAEIAGFFLIPELRGQGLGRKLFTRAMKDLENIKLVFLMTNPENSAALKVYLSFGFKIKSWHDNFYGNGQPRLRLEKINN